ncbi:MAPEG family protein [Roseateles sp.]|uniref:MAPEG family protein n=1 Tax=Roseateles sp. TaxID=1971397 RepID=UPI002E02C85F|nr:MAPEG family protein [Roseateles sp.]
MNFHQLHPVALACICILGVLLFGLGLAVSIARGKYKQLVGSPSDTDCRLNRVVRAHGNTAEYAPFLALLFVLHGASQPGTLVLWLMAIATAARVLLVAGLLTAKTLSRPSPLRFAGAATTYAVGVWLSVLLVTAG